MKMSNILYIRILILKIKSFVVMKKMLKFDILVPNEKCSLFPFPTLFYVLYMPGKCTNVSFIKQLLLI